ncbi:hypothetical protein GCM10027340_19090 [Marinomonas epiphytica]
MVTYWLLASKLTDTAQIARVELNERMDGIFSELKLVADNSVHSCHQEDIARLRRDTFFSPIFKEYGLFNQQYRVYCSNLGPTNFSLFSTIIERIVASPEQKTVSLVRSKTLGENSFIAFYLNDKGIGVNGLAPPQELLDDMSWVHNDFAYQLKLGQQVMSSHDNLDSNNALEVERVALEDWSISLELSLPRHLFFERLVQLIPWMLITLLVLTLAAYFVHSAFIYYLSSLSYCVKKAIKNNEMRVHFQPIVPLKKGLPVELEALLRWQSPIHGQVSPLTVIEVATRLGMLEQLTWNIVRRVGAFYRNNPQQLADIKTAINIERSSLLKENFVSQLQGILGEFPELKHKIVLEVTETDVLAEKEVSIIMQRFDEIKRLGVDLSVDDFGTGYSGLDFLRRFPYDTLKLDRFFVEALQEEQVTRQMLGSVTHLAKELNMQLIAEGIERKDQLEAVQALGIDRAQGYFFCRPLDKEKILQWLTEHPNRSFVSHT